MSDSEIIWNYLCSVIDDQDLITYIYCAGGARSKDNAIKGTYKIIAPVFESAINEELIKATIKGFLEFKKQEYSKGRIRIKPIYGD